MSNFPLAGCKMQSRQFERYLFNIKFASKEMRRLAARKGHESRLEEQKCRRSVARRNYENARVHAHKALRHREERTAYMRMAVQLDHVADNLQAMSISELTTRTFERLVRTIDQTIRSKDLNRITQVVGTFLKEYVNVETTCTSLEPRQVHAQEVDDLIKQIADEANLDLDKRLPEIREQEQRLLQLDQQQREQEQQDLDERLRKLRENIRYNFI